MDPRAPRAADPEHWFHADPNIYHGQVSGDNGTSHPCDPGCFGDESDEAVIASLPFNSHSTLDVRTRPAAAVASPRLAPHLLSLTPAACFASAPLSLPSPAKWETRWPNSGAVASSEVSPYLRLPALD